MKKTLVYLSTAMALLLAVHIMDILITDLSRLTPYGYGYLLGKIVVFLCVLSVVVPTHRYKIKTDGRKGRLATKQGHS